MNQLKIGSLVKSKAGRDADKYYIVLKIENEYCYLSDGKTRKIDCPKKKNTKHLTVFKQVANIGNMKDSDIKKFISGEIKKCQKATCLKRKE